MTYEQAKYMNGDETANAPHSPEMVKQAENEKQRYTTDNYKNPNPQPVGGKNLTYEQAKYNKQYEERNRQAQEGLQARQQEALNPVIGTVDDSVIDEGTSEETTTPYKPETMGDKEKSLYGNIEDNTVNSRQKLKEQGQNIKEDIESVVPRYDKKTWVGLMSDPNMTWDQKAELVLDALASGGKALTSGQVQQTDKKAINDTITQQYAENIADRDKRAMNSAIEPLEALNKQQTDSELRLRDTVVGAYIDRYNAAQSAETKKQVLEALINDKGTWASLEPKDKIDTLAYIQALDGEGSLLSMAIQMWAPDLMNKLDDILKGKSVRDAAKENEEGITHPDQIDVGGYSMGDLRNKDPAELLEELTASGVDVDTALKGMEDRINEELKSAGSGINPDYAKMASANKAKQVINQAQKQRKQNETNAKIDTTRLAMVKKANAMELGVVPGTPLNASLNVKKYNLLKYWNNKGWLNSSPDVAEEGQALMAEYGKNAVRDTLNDIKNNTNMKTSEKLEAMEKLVKDYSDVISPDMSLQKELNAQKMQLEYDQAYREPYKEKVGEYAYYEKNSKNPASPVSYMAVTKDGNMSDGKKVYDPAKYSFQPNNKITTSMVDYMLNSLSKEKVRGYIDPNMTDKELASIVKGTDQYKMLEKLAKNSNLQNAANAVNRKKELVDSALNEKYVKMIQMYNFWNKIY
jgi:hypothetical protein